MRMEFEQQPRESAKTFQAFKTYLEMGPDRSLAAVGAKLGNLEEVQKVGEKSADVERETYPLPPSALPVTTPADKG